jgi:hypothetical protein
MFWVAAAGGWQSVLLDRDGNEASSEMQGNRHERQQAHRGWREAERLFLQELRISIGVEPRSDPDLAPRRYRPGPGPV